MTTEGRTKRKTCELDDAGLARLKQAIRDGVIGHDLRMRFHVSGDYVAKVRAEVKEEDDRCRKTELPQQKSRR